MGSMSAANVAKAEAFAVLLKEALTPLLGDVQTTALDLGCQVGVRYAVNGGHHAFRVMLPTVAFEDGYVEVRL